MLTLCLVCQYDKVSALHKLTHMPSHDSYTSDLNSAELSVACLQDGLPETPSQADWLASTISSGSVGVDPMMMVRFFLTLMFREDKS